MLISSPSDEYPELGLLDYMGVLFLISQRTSILFSFHNDCTNIHFHKQCIKFPFSISSPTLVFFCLFFIIAILTGMQSYLTVILICISLMTEHLVIYLLAICTCPLENFLFRSFAHLWCFVFVFTELYKFLIFSF